MAIPRVEGSSNYVHVCRETELPFVGGSAVAVMSGAVYAPACRVLRRGGTADGRSGSFHAPHSHKGCTSSLHPFRLSQVILEPLLGGLEVLLGDLILMLGECVQQHQSWSSAREQDANPSPLRLDGAILSEVYRLAAGNRDGTSDQLGRSASLAGRESGRQIPQGREIPISTISVAIIFRVPEIQHWSASAAQSVVLDHILSGR